MHGKSMRTRGRGADLITTWWCTAAVGLSIVLSGGCNGDGRVEVPEADNDNSPPVAFAVLMVDGSQEAISGGDALPLNYPAEDLSFRFRAMGAGIDPGGVSAVLVEYSYVTVCGRLVGGRVEEREVSGPTPEERTAQEAVDGRASTIVWAGREMELADFACDLPEATNEVTVAWRVEAQDFAGNIAEHGSGLAPPLGSGSWPRVSYAAPTPDPNACFGGAYEVDPHTRRLRWVCPDD